MRLLIILLSTAVTHAAPPVGPGVHHAVCNERLSISSMRANLIYVRTGVIVSEKTAEDVTTALRDLLASNPSLFMELFQKCREPSYQFSTYEGEMALQGLYLLDPSGYPSFAVRNIVLSSVRIDGPALTIGSPRAATLNDGVAFIKPLHLEVLRRYYDSAFEVISAMVQIANSVEGVEMNVVPDMKPHYEDQIEFTGGMAVRFDAGLPRALYTPLGGLYFGSGHNPNGRIPVKVVEAIEKRFGLQFMSRLPNGAVYRVLRAANGNPLPPVIYRHSDQTLPYNEINATWALLKLNPPND